MWENHDPEQIANIDTWKKNIALVHRFYNDRRGGLANAQPNAAHHMIKKLQDTYGAKVFTQNVDDLFAKAGCEAIQVHGTLTEMLCVSCGRTWDIGYGEWSHEDRCECGSEWVKPNVVFFGEHAPHYSEMWADLTSMAKGDILLVMGTSGSVIPIGSVANRVKYRSVTTILSNLETNTLPNFIGDPQIQDGQFQYVRHGRASEKADEIYALIEEIIENGTE